MDKCAYPQHHQGSSRGLGLVAVVAAAAAIWAERRIVVEVLIWAGAFVALALVAAAVLTVVLLLRHHDADVAHGRHLRLSWLRNVPRAACVAALRWHHLTRNLALASADRHAKNKTLHPRAIVLPSAYGVTAKVRTVPGSGRAEFDEAAEHIANYWRCMRVSVSQPKPGRLVVRGLRRDPLLELLTEIPPGRDLRRLYLGRDEHGADRFADLANVPGICVGGMPGAGKSTEITSWITQLAPSPAVQFALADGKNAGEFDDFADRAYVMAGDDLDEVIDLLEKQHTLMTDRLAAVRAVLGVKNAWHIGPSEAWPLSVTVLDECQSYLDLTAVKGDKSLEPKVRRCIFLTSSLIRRGQSVMMLTIPATQKPTTDSLPSSIRDNCPISLCFGVKTIDAAAATLGTEIRRYESYSPESPSPDPAYAGMLHRDSQDGPGSVHAASRVRTSPRSRRPRSLAGSAHLRRDPRTAVPVIVPDDASALRAS